MTVEELIQILENRIRHNNVQRDAAAERGDLALLVFYEQDNASTSATLAVLRNA